MRLEDEQGRQTTVRPTGFHKFFSADRGEWISADSIREGERLTALGGTVRLLSRTRLPGTHRVYNLTVEGEHVYHVTNLVVDGHNNGCGPEDMARARQRYYEGDADVIRSKQLRDQYNELQDDIWNPDSRVTTDDMKAIIDEINEIWGTDFDWDVWFDYP